MLKRRAVARRGELAMSAWKYGSSFNGRLKRGICFLVAVIALHAAGWLTGAGRAQQPEPPAVKEEGPPIVKLPLDIVEPPRNVPAAEWNSPYCGHRDDGCTECTRGNAGGSAQCHQESDGTGQNQSTPRATVCERRAIICFKEIDSTYFDRICSGFLDEEFFRRRDGRIIANEYAMRVDWILSGGKYTSERVTRLDPRLFIGPGISVLYPDGYRGYDAQRDGSFAGSPLAFGLDGSGLRCTNSYADQ
jgi:hypothetical protein